MTAGGDPRREDRARTVFEAFYQRHQNTWRHYAFLHTADGRAAEKVADHLTRRLLNCWEEAISAESVERYAWALFKQELDRWLEERDAGSGFVRATAFERAVRAYAWNGGIELLEESLWLYRAITDLPERQHEVMVLRYVMHLGEEDIAETLGIASASVRSSLRHARNTLEPEASARHLLHTTENEG